MDDLRLPGTDQHTIATVVKALVQLPVLNPLDTCHWRDDLRGGLRAAAVALPLGLAFGVVSGAGPVAGLYCAICTGIFAALFGGTPTQIAGLAGPITIVMASVFLQFAEQPAAAVGVVMLVGVIQMTFGALRLGKYISLIPYPVISGFSSGVGCIIIVMQFNPLLGQPSVSISTTAPRWRSNPLFAEPRKMTSSLSWSACTIRSCVHSFAPGRNR